MSGAVEVTQEEHDRLKAEYSAAYAKTGAADAGNAAAGAADTSSQTTTSGETTDASATSASAGDASPSDAPAEKPITDEDLRALSNAAVQAGKRNDVLALVKKYAIEAISKCPAEKRPQLKKDLEALAPATEDAALA
jgi:hypothetical protein